MAGYRGGCDAVRRFGRSLEHQQAVAEVDAYIPLVFAPGEAFQFDWSHEVVEIGGSRVTAKVAHVRLCHSRMPFLRAFPHEAQEMVFDAHDKAFAFWRVNHKKVERLWREEGLQLPARYKKRKRL